MWQELYTASCHGDDFVGYETNLDIVKPGSRKACCVGSLEVNDEFSVDGVGYFDA